MCETVDRRSMQHQTESNPEKERVTADKIWPSKSCVKYFHAQFLQGAAVFTGESLAFFWCFIVVGIGKRFYIL